MIGVRVACDTPLTFVKRGALYLDVMYFDQNCQFVHHGILDIGLNVSAQVLVLRLYPNPSLSMQRHGRLCR